MCLSSYHLAIPISPTNNVTKCVQTGPGWSVSVKESSFIINGTNTPKSNDSLEVGDVSVTISSSDRAVFLPNGSFSESSHYSNGTKASFDPACIGPFDNATLPADPHCDWDWFFSSS